MRSLFKLDFYLLLVASVALTGNFVAADGNSVDAPGYEVNRVLTSAPTIDGIVADGEWDGAAAVAGDWIDLVSHETDQHNLRFRMLWDDANLYVLGETDWNGFGTPTDFNTNPGSAGSTYNPNFIFDPNLDAEDLSVLPRDDSAVDGYLVSWSMSEGSVQRRTTPGDAERALRDPLDGDAEFISDYIAGLRVDAHVNATSGNQGLLAGLDDNSGPNQNWRDDQFPSLVYALVADNVDLNETGEAGGLWEFSIGWDFFSATDPNRLLTADDEDFGDVGDPDPRFADPTATEFLENGLYAVSGPTAGDVWAFETGVATNDEENAFPSWSEPQDGDETRDAFAAWGASAHGRITFMPEPPPPEPPVVDPPVIDPVVCDPNTGGDLNGDGVVSFPDFLMLSSNFAKSVTDHTQGDVNCDGEVGFPDFLQLGDAFGVAQPDPDPPVVDPPVVDPPVVDPPVVDPPVVDPPVVDPPVVDPPVVCDPNTGGDLNGDGVVSFPDFLTLSSNFGTNVDGHQAGDINCDGAVSFPDFLQMGDAFGVAANPDPDPPVVDPPIVAPPVIDPPVVCDPNTGGDLNGDGVVSFPDFLVLSSNFGTAADSHTAGDLNCDGMVSFPDFLLMGDAFGVAQNNQAASVPEPSGQLLIAFGLFALVRWRKK